MIRIDPVAAIARVDLFQIRNLPFSISREKITTLACIFRWISVLIFLRLNLPAARGSSGNMFWLERSEHNLVMSKSPTSCCPPGHNGSCTILRFNSFLIFIGTFWTCNEPCKYNARICMPLSYPILHLICNKHAPLHNAKPVLYYIRSEYPPIHFSHPY